MGEDMLSAKRWASCSFRSSAGSRLWDHLLHRQCSSGSRLDHHSRAEVSSRGHWVWQAVRAKSAARDGSLLRAQVLRSPLKKWAVMS